jgi:hypothetical protein
MKPYEITLLCVCTRLCVWGEWMLNFLIISLRTKGQSCWFTVMCNLHLEEVTSHCYFRGVLPFGQRKRLWEKHRAKSRKHRPSTVAADIVCGSQVCMKNSPMYQPGAIGKYVVTIWVVVWQEVKIEDNVSEHCLIRWHTILNVLVWCMWVSLCSDDYIFIMKVNSSICCISFVFKLYSVIQKTSFRYHLKFHHTSWSQFCFASSQITCN